MDLVDALVDYATSPGGKTKKEKWTGEEEIEMESGSILKCWRHVKTNARVRLMSAPGPMVNMYAVVATEAVTNEWSHGDDGLPHTLEHLVFLGSKDYPYKGVLDKLANRCLARGTNAWTDVDHTAYTATTAGSVGLLSLLPIYMDHILRPTLTESGFVTEVHHVTGEGEDKGVVYCEMQGRETTAESLAERACLGALYPDPQCGYASETGGICKNLRALTNAQVRRYHGEYYRPSNLCLIITGVVDVDELLDVCDAALERSVAQAEAKEEQERPWTRPVAPLPNDGSVVRHSVEFPAADGDDTGLVVLAWRGNSYGSYFEDAKQGMLWAYLTDGAAAPGTKAFVNSGDCSGVWPTSDRLRVGYRQLWFEDVAVEKLEEIDAKFIDVLKVIKDEDIDIGRMKDVVGRAKRRTRAALEDDPATAIVTPVLKHFLYAEDPDDGDTLGEAADPLRLLEMVDKVDAAEWRRTFDDLFSSKKPRIVVVATPSAKRAAKERTDEDDRIASTKATLGEDGLKEKSSVVDAAVNENEKPPPSSMLQDAVSPPDIQEAIDKMFHVDQLALSENGSTGGGLLLKVDGTQFCRVDLACATASIPQHLRQYLPLLSELLFTSPTEDGSRPYEEVVDELRRQTVQYGAGTGMAGGGTSDIFFVGAKLDKEDRWFGPRVVQTAVKDAKLVEDRLRAAVSKLSLEYATELRDGSSAARAAMKASLYDPAETNMGLFLPAPQKLLLDKIKFALSPLGQLIGRKHRVLSDLSDLRTCLLESSEKFACISGDLASKEATETVAQFPVTTNATKFDRYVVNEMAQWGRRVFVGVAALEGGTAYLSRCGPGPDIADLENLAALSVVIEYLCALEGDFWTKIRGTGLAYGAGLRADGASKLVHFSLYRSADPISALTAAKDVVTAYADGTAKFRPVDFDNARGSLASGLVEREKTRSNAIAGAYQRALLGLETDRHLNFIAAVATVTEETALQALHTYLVPLFQDQHAVTAISAAPAKLTDLETAFNAKFDPNVPSLVIPDVLTAFKSLPPNSQQGPFFSNLQLSSSSSSRGFLTKNRLLLATIVSGALGLGLVALQKRGVSLRSLLRLQ